MEEVGGRVGGRGELLTAEECSSILTGRREKEQGGIHSPAL